MFNKKKFKIFNIFYVCIYFYHFYYFFMYLFFASLSWGHSLALPLQMWRRLLLVAGLETIESTSCWIACGLYQAGGWPIALMILSGSGRARHDYGVSVYTRWCECPSWHLQVSEEPVHLPHKHPCVPGGWCLHPGSHLWFVKGWVIINTNIFLVWHF